MFSYFRLLSLLAVSLAFPAFAEAAAKLTGHISTISAVVDEDVLYELEIQDGSPDRLPDFPKIEGVDVSSAGRNNHTIFSNGSVSQTVTYRYRLRPRREGEITIPAIDVLVDGTMLSTQPVKLKVTSPEKTVGAGDYAFGEIKTSRPFAYVGEDVQVEIRLYLETSARWSLAGAPNPKMDGDGYSSRNLILGDETEVEVAGKSYRRAVFRTAITPNRAGKISIGPAPIRMNYSKRVNDQNDRFGVLFDRSRQVLITAPAIELEVKPLPVDGRPADFSGAIGDFRMTGETQSKTVKIGEPFGMTVQISGQGNFDRIAVPTLADPDDWQTYPPGDRFDANDNLGLTGTKTFQFAVTPQAKKNTTPVFRFSYFDSAREKYVTLATAPSPLTVEGTPPPAVAVPSTISNGGTPSEKPAVPPQDILALRPLPGFWAHAWAPSPVAGLTLLLVPLPMLIALFAWRARRADPRAALRKELLRERSALLAKVRSTQDREELYDTGGRLLELEVALATNQPAASIDEAAVLARTDHTAVKQLLAARTELVYAGSASGTVSHQDRDLVLEAVEQLGKSQR